MKKTLLLLMLMAGIYQLKAQNHLQLIKPMDTSSYKLKDDYLFKTPNSTNLQAGPNLLLNNNLAMLNQSSISPVDHMPIARLTGHSNMPVVKLNRNSRMPVVNLNKQERLDLPKRDTALLGR